MKTRFFYSIVLLFVAVFMMGCNSSNYIKGYIPVEAKPNYSWSEHGGRYSRVPQIMVVTSKGDTILAGFNPENAPYVVRYKDSYPPSVGKKVYVLMNHKGREYFIFDALLDSVR